MYQNQIALNNDKEKAPKEKKMNITYMEIEIRQTADFSSEAMQAKQQ